MGDLNLACLGGGVNADFGEGVIFKFETQTSVDMYIAILVVSDTRTIISFLLLNTCVKSFYIGIKTQIQNYSEFESFKASLVVLISFLARKPSSSCHFGVRSMVCSLVSQSHLMREIQY